MMHERVNALTVYAKRHILPMSNMRMHYILFCDPSFLLPFQPCARTRYAHFLDSSLKPQMQLLLVRTALGTPQEMGVGVSLQTKAMTQPDVRGYIAMDDSSADTAAVDRIDVRFDSVVAGPHRPFQAGPGLNDSTIHVVYANEQVYPEYLVTYEMDVDDEEKSCDLAQEGGSEVGGVGRAPPSPPSARVAAMAPPPPRPTLGGGGGWFVPGSGGGGGGGGVGGGGAGGSGAGGGNPIVGLTPSSTHVVGTNDPKDMITICIRDKLGEETFFKFKRTTLLSKIFDAYGARCGVQLSGERQVFLFNGERVAADLTPEQAGMSDQDIIECVLECDSVGVGGGVGGGAGGGAGGDGV